MSLSKRKQLQHQSVNPNHVLVANTLLVAFHSKMLEAEALQGLCLEGKLQGTYVEWLGKQSRAGSSRSLTPLKISIDNNKVQ